jgi:hypothetical protein
MKNTYSPHLILEYQLGKLDAELMNIIPSSTLHNWKNRDISNIIGLEHPDSLDGKRELIFAIIKNNKLEKTCKALFFLLLTYIKIVGSLDNKNKILKQYKQEIIKTIDLTKCTIGFNRALKAFAISSQKYYRWKSEKKCRFSPINLCRKIYYNQLSLSETNVIKKYLKMPEYIHWPSNSVFYQMLRDKAAYMSLTTFYKYSKIFNLRRTPPPNRKREHTTGIRAEKPGQILHMDVTIYRPTDYCKVYVYFIMDNYSRCILGWKASLKYSADIALENLKEVCEKYNFYDPEIRADLITDDGPENNGGVKRFTSMDCVSLRQLIAQKDIIYSNSMVEAINKTMKYYFLFTQTLPDFEATVKYLEKAVPENNNRPIQNLYGLTPLQVYEKKYIPDRNYFAPQIKEAAIKRREKNLKCNLCDELAVDFDTTNYQQ